MPHANVPNFELKIGGTTIKQEDGSQLENMVVEDHVDMVESAIIRLGGAEGQPDWNINIGDEVEIKTGEGNGYLFKGEVIGLEPSWGLDGLATLSIRALDKSHRLSRGRKTRFFEKKKDSDIVQSVAGEAGLQVDSDATQEVHDYTLQRNESDLTFLKRLAARNNYTLSVDEGKLIFKKATTSGSTKVKMGENLRSLRMAFNSMDQVKQVIVRGWDVREKKEIVGKASIGDVESIGGGDVGSNVSSGKFGDSTAYITDVPISSQSQANELAKSEMNRLARQFAKGSCTVEGSDTLRAGSVVTFEGLPNKHNGKFFIISSRHIVTPKSGYLTEISFCSNTFGS